MEESGSMHKFMFFMLILMIISILIGFFWDSLYLVKSTIHFILDPTLGTLLNWNLTGGMTLTIIIIALITTIIQKYATDQKTIREIKIEQKELQKELSKYKNNPEKMLEIQKNLMPTTFKLMELTMKSSFYTIIPFILMFRWFMDYFSEFPEFRFLGFLSWFWFYLISIMIFSSIFRKILNVA